MKKQNIRTLSFIVGTFTYLLFGAAIFNALESQHEESTRANLTQEEKRYKTDYNINQSDYEDLEQIVVKYHAYRTYPQWKFVGALYFSLTVITTIGYGHSTPQTEEGKIFCMIYAIIGIPLCIVMYQSLGERLNYFSSFCIQFVKKCFKCRKKEVSQTEMVTTTFVLAVIVVLGGAAMFKSYENWNYFDSIYYCIITLTTIGFGDYVAMQNNLGDIEYVVFTFTFILLGLTIVASTLNLVVLKFLTMNTDDERKENEFNRKSIYEQSNNSDFYNVNGDLLCSFEQTDLDDLKATNNLKSCFPFNKTKRTQFFNYFHKNSNKTNNHSSTSKNKVLEQTPTLNITSSKSSCSLSCHSSAIHNNNNNNNNKNSSFHKMINKNDKSNTKLHYSIRRGPGQISHLLMPQRIDLILLNSTSLAKKHEFKHNSNNNNSNSLNQIDNVVISDKSNNSNVNINPKSNSLMFDIKLFIDDESQQDDNNDNYFKNNNSKNDANNITTSTSDQDLNYNKSRTNDDEIQV